MNNSKKKILIVDDEPDVIEFLSYNFIKNGYEVAGAGTGIAGVEKVSTFLPDIIIADIMMPDMGGIMMCNILKSNDAYKDIPIIFLSAVQDEYITIYAGMSGNDYISKPATFSFIKLVVEKYFTNCESTLTIE